MGFMDFAYAAREPGLDQSRYRSIGALPPVLDNGNEGPVSLQLTALPDVGGLLCI